LVARKATSALGARPVQSPAGAFDATCPAVEAVSTSSEDKGFMHRRVVALLAAAALGGGAERFI
jgi:hypothetical protein